MSKAALARLKRLEAALKPTAKGPSNAGPIALWRQDVDTQLCRAEFGGPWVDESEMLASLPPVVSKSRPRVVIVKGCWSQVEQHKEKSR